MRNLGRFKRYFIAAGVALILAIVSLVAYFVPSKSLLSAYEIGAIGEGELRLHFLYVGQGDCTIAEFPDGEIFLIDAGRGDFQEENHLIRYLKGLKPQKVNMILTHADSDHYGGFTELLGEWEVEKFYLPVLPSENKDYTRLLQTIEREGCETETLKRYSSIECAGGYFICLSPYSMGETNENDSSAVLYLNYGGFRAVFCADISSSRENRLVREYRMDERIFDTREHEVLLENADVMKIAHHGSAESSCAAWMELVRPKASFLSCGKGNDYKFPRAETLGRIKEANPEGEIYRMDELGDLIVTVKDGTFEVARREAL